MKQLAVIVAALALAAPAVAGRIALGVPGFPNFPKAWSHAVVNIVVRKTPHTLTLDRGRIIQINTTQLTLRERDGTSPVIPITSSTIVTIQGQPASILDLRKRYLAETLRVDGGAAVRVRVTSRL